MSWESTYIDVYKLASDGVTAPVSRYLNRSKNFEVVSPQYQVSLLEMSNLFQRMNRIQERSLFGKCSKLDFANESISSVRHQIERLLSLIDEYERGGNHRYLKIYLNSLATLSELINEVEELVMFALDQVVKTFSLLEINKANETSSEIHCVTTLTTMLSEMDVLHEKSLPTAG